MSVWEFTGSSIQYTLVSSTPYTIADDDLLEGTNIFGVNVASATTITLPASPGVGKVIIINDESGNASVNNITIQSN